MADKQKERTLEMRVAELESKLGGEQIEFTEDEVAAYNKIAAALGVSAEGAAESAAGYTPLCRVHPCRVHTCRIQTCRIHTCRIQTCRIQTCRIQTCRINQCIQQCINECGVCFVSEFEDDLTGGFRGLGY